MKQPKWILLAEDNSSDADLALRALTTHDPHIDVVVAHDGVEALDCLNRRGKFRGNAGTNNPTLMLLDLKMPRMDGSEVLRQIRANRLFNTIPVVMFTSSGEETDLRRCYQLGANAYVIKPVGFEDYSRALEEIVLFWTVINEPPPAANTDNPQPRASELIAAGPMGITGPGPGHPN